MALLVVDVAAVVLLAIGCFALEHVNREEVVFRHYNRWIRRAGGLYLLGVAVFATDLVRWRPNRQTRDEALWAFSQRLAIAIAVTLALLLVLRRVGVRVRATRTTVTVLEGSTVRAEVALVDVRRIRHTRHDRDGSPRWWTRNYTLDEGLYVLERTNGSIVFLPLVNRNGAMFRELRRRIDAAAAQPVVILEEPARGNQWSRPAGRGWGGAEH